MQTMLVQIPQHVRRLGVRRSAGWDHVSTQARSNKRLQLTPYSLRFAPAFGRGSPPALDAGTHGAHECQSSFDGLLSHNSKDESRVLRLTQRLPAAGFRGWFDGRVIKRRVKASRVQVLCQSLMALKSDWVGLEHNTVLRRDSSNAGRYFISLLLSQ
jgi:hypothetical protein